MASSLPVGRFVEPAGRLLGSEVHALTDRSGNLLGQLDRDSVAGPGGSSAGRSSGACRTPGGSEAAGRTEYHQADDDSPRPRTRDRERPIAPDRPLTRSPDSPLSRDQIDEPALPPGRAASPRSRRRGSCVGTGPSSSAHPARPAAEGREQDLGGRVQGGLSWDRAIDQMPIGVTRMIIVGVRTRRKPCDWIAPQTATTEARGNGEPAGARLPSGRGRAISPSKVWHPPRSASCECRTNSLPGRVSGRARRLSESAPAVSGRVAVAICHIGADPSGGFVTRSYPGNQSTHERSRWKARRGRRVRAWLGRSSQDAGRRARRRSGHGRRADRGSTSSANRRPPDWRSPASRPSRPPTAARLLAWFSPARASVTP